MTVKRDAVTQPGFVSVIDNEGMPVHGTMVSDAPEHDTRAGRDMLFGKLYLEWQLVLPETVDPALRKGELLRRVERSFASLNVIADEAFSLTIEQCWRRCRVVRRMHPPALITKSSDLENHAHIAIYELDTKKDCDRSSLRV